RYAGPLTAGILASLIVSNSLTAGTDLTIDARLVGVAVATIAALARLPLALTLILAVAATALTRLLT
ncbi:MAG: AzlD domain-containing protein, partial [Actinomycetia bacterium]|nr:AzlD domain-containing protein [Actinomycetes bacterium]